MVELNKRARPPPFLFRRGRCNPLKPNGQASLRSESPCSCVNHDSVIASTSTSAETMCCWISSPFLTMDRAFRRPIAGLRRAGALVHFLTDAPPREPRLVGKKFRIPHSRIVLYVLAGNRSGLDSDVGSGIAKNTSQNPAVYTIENYLKLDKPCSPIPHVTNLLTFVRKKLGKNNYLCKINRTTSSVQPFGGATRWTSRPRWGAVRNGIWQRPAVRQRRVPQLLSKKRSTPRYVQPGLPPVKRMAERKNKKYAVLRPRYSFTWSLCLFSISGRFQNFGTGSFFRSSQLLGVDQNHNVVLGEVTEVMEMVRHFMKFGFVHFIRVMPIFRFILRKKKKRQRPIPDLQAEPILIQTAMERTRSPKLGPGCLEQESSRKKTCQGYLFFKSESDNVSFSEAHIPCFAPEFCRVWFSPVFAERICGQSRCGKWASHGLLRQKGFQMVG